MSVRAATHAQIRFDVASPKDAELVIKHLNNGSLLARECRPVAVGASAVEIKTHPEASHIGIALEVGGRPVHTGRFQVNCGERIEPTARHFIVIGAMKAGTTTLFERLAEHPALCRTWAQLPGVSSTKEINYFHKVYRKQDTPLHYDWRFPFDAARHAWTLDVSPNYAKLPESKVVPGRIATLGGEIKLAYILREPVDRIESHLAHTLRRKGEIKSMRHCLRVSCYAQHLDNFVKHCAIEDVLLLDFEQLRRNPTAVLVQVCDFLGIDRFVGSSVIHNRRGIDFRLDAKQRAELADAVRPDVQRLISHYGFKPARKWLRTSKLRRIREFVFRP